MFAPYDKTLERFVGGTHATKGDAESEATELRKSRQHKGHKLEVRDLNPDSKS